MVTIDIKEAKELYEDHNKFQQLLIETFGEQCFKKFNYKDIKTFDDAYKWATKQAKEDYHNSINSSSPAYIIAMAKIVLITDVMKQGVVFDWSNTDQRKWRPWFILSSGVAFDSSNYNYTMTGSVLGSRLCYISEEISDYVAKTFIDLFTEVLIIKN